MGPPPELPEGNCPADLLAVDGHVGFLQNHKDQKKIKHKRLGWFKPLSLGTCVTVDGIIFLKDVSLRPLPPSWNASVTIGLSIF